jgi:hypothetical protein
MSAGGQRSLDVSGITSMRLRDAADFTLQAKDVLVYQTFNSTTGANAYANRVANGNDYYLQFLKGAKECAVTGNATCAGQPYQMSLVMKFRY